MKTKLIKKSVVILASVFAWISLTASADSSSPLNLSGYSGPLYLGQAVNFYNTWISPIEDAVTNNDNLVNSFSQTAIQSSISSDISAYIQNNNLGLLTASDLSQQPYVGDMIAGINTNISSGNNATHLFNTINYSLTGSNANLNQIPLNAANATSSNVMKNITSDAIAASHGALATMNTQVTANTTLAGTNVALQSTMNQLANTYLAGSPSTTPLFSLYTSSVANAKITDPTSTGMLDLLNASFSAGECQENVSASTDPLCYLDNLLDTNSAQNNVLATTNSQIQTASGNKNLSLDILKTSVFQTSGNSIGLLDQQKGLPNVFANLANFSKQGGNYATVVSEVAANTKQLSGQSSSSLNKNIAQSINNYLNNSGSLEPSGKSGTLSLAEIHNDLNQNDPNSMYSSIVNNYNAMGTSTALNKTIDNSLKKNQSILWNQQGYCAIVSPLGGGQSDYQHIQNALSQCSTESNANNGQQEIVKLTAGTFNLTLPPVDPGYLDLYPHVSLQGDGQNNTVINLYIGQLTAERSDAFVAEDGSSLADLTLNINSTPNYINALHDVVTIYKNTNDPNAPSFSINKVDMNIEPGVLIVGVINNHSVYSGSSVYQTNVSIDDLNIMGNKNSIANFADYQFTSDFNEGSLAINHSTLYAVASFQASQNLLGGLAIYNSVVPNTNGLYGSTPSVHGAACHDNFLNGQAPPSNICVAANS